MVRCDVVRRDVWCALVGGDGEVMLNAEKQTIVYQRRVECMRMPKQVSGMDAAFAGAVRCVGRSKLVNACGSMGVDDDLGPC